MLNAFRLMVLNEYRERYRHPRTLAGDLAAMLLMLACYWYTASAFEPNFATGLEKYGHSYFGYLVIGEAAMLLPLALVSAVPRALKQAMASGALDSFILSGRPAAVWTLLLSAAGIPRLVIWNSLLIGFSFVLGLKFPATSLAAAVCIQIISMPIFAGLGMISGAILVRNGRGESASQQLLQVASLAAGIYFPVSVLPAALQAAARRASPLNPLLETSRTVIVTGRFTDILPALAILGLWAVVIFPTGWFLLSRSFYVLRKKGFVTYT